MSDTELLDRLLAGEQTAYRELVARYQGAMRAVAYAIVGSRHADEVVQDAWLAVVRSLAGFQGRSSLKTWLLTITANTAKTRLKHNRREVLLDDLAAPHARWVTSVSPMAATGCWRPMPGIRTAPKRCSPKTNCASAWNTHWPACPSCRPACWCCCTGHAL